MAKRKPKAGKLTSAQQRFILAVAEGVTKAEAYARAYPRSAHWKPESRAVAASHLLSQPHVARAYKEELARVEAEAQKRADWSREKSIKARLEFKQKLEDEIERRKVATLAEAEVLRISPPTDKSPGEIVGAICRILQKPILTAGASNAYHANLDGLDKAAAIDRDADAIEAEAVTFTAWPSDSAADGGKDAEG